LSKPLWKTTSRPFLLLLLLLLLNQMDSKQLSIADGQPVPDPLSSPTAPNPTDVLCAPPPVCNDVKFEALLPIMSRLPLSAESVGDHNGKKQSASVDGNRGGNCLENEVHYTKARLPEIDEASLVLWRTLHGLRAVTADYAGGFLSNYQPRVHHGCSHTCPAAAATSTSSKNLAALEVIRRVFNWDRLAELPVDLTGEWYGVAFRSARKKGSESLSLYEADRLAHEEAVRSGGLLVYWYGVPDPATGENLATCIWTSRALAIKANSLPMHATAARFAKEAYALYDLERYTVKKLAGETKLRIEPCVDVKEN